MEQDGANQNITSSAVQCRFGCGFYASSAFDGLCSKCYNEVLKQQKQGLQMVPTTSNGGNGQAPFSSDMAGGNPVPSEAAVGPSTSTVIGPSSSAPAVPRVQSSTDATQLASDSSSLQSLSSESATAGILTSGPNTSETISPSSMDVSSSSMCTAMNLASISGATVSSSTPSGVETNIGRSGAGVEVGLHTVTSGFMQDITDASSVDDDTTDSSATDSSATLTDAEAKSRPKKNRCHICKKKVALTGFECRCGGLYCSAHRYSDTHQCTFNYKEHGQEELRKSNPVVVSSKVQKI